MNATELFHKDGTSTGVFYCAACRTVHTSEGFAEKCCAPRFCVSQDQFHCGKELTRSDYGVICSACSDNKHDHDMADKLEKAELVTDYDGWVWSHEAPGYKDGFYENVEDFMDYLHDNDDLRFIDRPQFAFCCKGDPPQSVDIGDVLEQMFADSFEDAQDQAEGEDELEAALNAFWEKNKHIVSWTPDYTRKVLIPHE